MKRLVSLCLAGLVLAFAAPSAGAEIQRPHEVITVGFPTKDGFFVYATLHPRERVAVLGTQIELEGPASGKWASTSYVERVPRSSFGDTIHVDFGPLGRVDGRFVADVPPHHGHVSQFCRGRRPVTENGYFAGKVVFRGDGDYLDVVTHRAQASVVRRTFRLRCKQGHAGKFENPRPGLFGYVQAPTDFFSDNDGTFLRSVLRSEDLVTEFEALDHFSGDTAGFKAVAREWLPGEVATTRSIEIERAPGSSFELTGPEEQPEAAVVHPPPPFSGSAEYLRDLGSFSGDLAVSFLGKDLPLAGLGAETEICPRPRRDDLWDCP